MAQAGVMLQLADCGLGWGGKRLERLTAHGRGSEAAEEARGAGRNKSQQANKASTARKIVAARTANRFIRSFPGREPPFTPSG